MSQLSLYPRHLGSRLTRTFSAFTLIAFLFLVGKNALDNMNETPSRRLKRAFYLRTYEVPPVRGEGTALAGAMVPEAVSYGLGQESKLAQPHSTNVRKLKYLTFGASITYGSGLIDRSNAYPNLLSPDARNLAIPASGPAYPAMCVQSMIGDDDDHEPYDVIILEYNNPVDGIIELAQRLRQRYPDAILIVMHLAYPLIIENKTTMDNLKSWADKYHQIEDLHSTSLKEVFLNSNDDWRWNDVAKPPHMSNEAVRRNNGFHLTMPISDDPKDFIYHADWISPDWLHFSEKGHEIIAQSVMDLVTSVGVVPNPRLGTWASGDSCHSWFKDGKYPNVPAGYPGHSDNVRMEMFNNFLGGRYALEIPKEGGLVSISNPFDVPMELILSYMVTRPKPSKYPATKLTIGGDESSAVILDPVAPLSYGEVGHFSFTKSVGEVQPGINFIHMKPLEETHFPFRLTSIAVSEKRQFVDVSTPFYRGDWVISRSDDN